MECHFHRRWLHLLFLVSRFQIVKIITRENASFPREPLPVPRYVGLDSFAGCLRDGTEGPSTAVLIGSLCSELFLTAGEARCIAEPADKRYKRTPHKNNPPYIQPHIRRWIYLSKYWESSIVIPQRLLQRSFALRLQVFHFLREPICLSRREEARFAPR